MKTRITLILMTLTVMSFAQTLNAPESVVFDQANNRYLVSNAASGVSGGSIVSLDRNTLAISPFISTGVNSPKGMAIVGNDLWFTDFTNVRKADLTTGTVTQTISPPSAQFCNDILHVNGFLYISDTQGNKIYKYDIANQTFSQITTSIQSPNGMANDSTHQRIILVSFRANSPIQGIDIANDSVYTIATTTLSNLDGVAIDRSDNVYVSSWGSNAIFRSDCCVSSPFTQFATGLSGPADFCIAENDSMIVPNFNNNTISYFFISAGIHQPPVNKEYLIFPNPATEHTYLNTNYIGGITIQVFASDGKLMSTQKASAMKNDAILIDTKDLSAGYYFLQIRQEDGKIQSLPFVKK